MTVQPYELSPENTLQRPLPALPTTTSDPSAQQTPPSTNGDAIARVLPPPNDNNAYGNGYGGNAYAGGIFGGFGGGGFGGFGGFSNAGLVGTITGLIAQLGTLLSQLLQAPANTNGNGQQFFHNATASSTGDPHLSFDGNTWDSMVNEPNLLNSSSFPGGFQISTQVTPPNDASVTYNHQATITTNFGATAVSLDNAGNATIMQNGQNYPLVNGASLDLGNGDAVTRNQDGSVVFNAYSPSGGAIVTTLRDVGQGVNVNITAQNVNLGGALVEGNTRRAHTT